MSDGFNSRPLNIIQTANDRRLVRIQKADGFKELEPEFERRWNDDEDFDSLFADFEKRLGLNKEIKP